MKVGFFGGAFDPFHVEHKNIILSAKEELNLDRIVVYPSYLPPHKSCVGDFDLRLATVIEGTKDISSVEVDTIERDRGVSNPTYQVLPLLKEKYSVDKAYLIIGGDSMLNFSRWLKPEVIAKECTLLVAGRSGVDLEKGITLAQEKYGADIKVLSYVGKEVSSSIIKAQIILGENSPYLDSGVQKILVEAKAYGEFDCIIEKLKNNLTERTFAHVKRTVFYALKLNTKLGLDFKKVFLACLLHDCTKNQKISMDGVIDQVVHQYTGAKSAEADYGITDEEILDAIKYHTTGKAHMSELGKLVYCADMLEEGRVYQGVEDLRKTIESDFQKGFLACINASMDNILSKKSPVDPLTKECCLYYNNL